MIIKIYSFQPDEHSMINLKKRDYISINLYIKDLLNKNKSVKFLFKISILLFKIYFLKTLVMQFRIQNLI